MERDYEAERVAGPRCECCEAGRLVTEYRSDSFEHEGETGTVAIKANRVPFEVCNSCKSTFVTRDTLRARHEALCRQLGLITPAETLQIREHHGLNRARFAKITRFGEASLFRWERGRSLPNQSNSNYMKLLLQNPANVEFLLAQDAKSTEESVAKTLGE